MICNAYVATPAAGGHAALLCARLAGEADVTRLGYGSQIDFLDGTCSLVAEPGALALRVEADDAETVARLAGVVARHLADGPEALRIAWSPARASRPPR